jgi:hypothetical protein
MKTMAETKTLDARVATSMWIAAVLCVPDRREDQSKHDNIDSSYSGPRNNAFIRRYEEGESR